MADFCRDALARQQSFAVFRNKKSAQPEPRAVGSNF
jgi:hypothetical protein